MDHLTITEVPTVPAEEILPGQQLLDGRVVTEVLSIKNDSHRVLRLSNGDSVQYFKDDPVAVTVRPVTQTGTIDITPVGMTSPEGRKRVAEAQQEWDMATHALANSVQAVLDELMDRDTDKITRVEYYSQLQTLIGIRQVKQEAFLRAVAGGKEQPASATLAGTPRLSDTPTTSSIETANYVSAPNGSSWVIRDKRKGEVIAFRPDHQSAQKAMESLESTGSLA